jgi:hypothetical protein
MARLAARAWAANWCMGFCCAGVVRWRAPTGAWGFGAAVARADWCRPGRTSGMVWRGVGGRGDCGWFGRVLRAGGGGGLGRRIGAWGFAAPASRGGRAPTGAWGFARRAARSAAGGGMRAGGRLGCGFAGVGAGGGGGLDAGFHVVWDCVLRRGAGQVGGADRSGTFLRPFHNAGGHVGWAGSAIAADSCRLRLMTVRADVGCDGRGHVAGSGTGSAAVRGRRTSRL